MIRLDADAMCAALASLDRLGLNNGFARAVLDGKVDGTLVGDRASAPRVLHALHPYGMSLVWGEAVDEAFDAVVAHLRAGAYRGRAEWLQVDPRWDTLPWDRALGAVPAEGADESAPCTRYARVSFRFDAACFLARTPAAVAAGWQLRRAVASDFALAGSVVPAHFWRDADQFLAAGGGWCAERDGSVGAIAFTSFRSGDELELGIETFAAARRQGLGRAVAARMVGELVQSGITPVWSCRRENVASHELAQQLGFVPTLILPYYRLAA